MKYFTNCKTIEEVKKEYRKLASKLHPDMNIGTDTTEAFQEMQNDYNKAFEMLKDTHKGQDGETYEKATNETSKQYSDIIDNLIHFDGVAIEIIGSWIWLTGNTFEYKDEIKKLKFKWSSKKKAWYFHSEPFKKHSKKSLSLDEIRNKYGSEKIRTETTTRIA